MNVSKTKLKKKENQLHGQDFRRTLEKGGGSVCVCVCVCVHVCYCAAFVQYLAFRDFFTQPAAGVEQFARL